MRLNRLDLTRYGKFTDRTIDFGPAHANQPDLHIIYGPNEAGKSTTLAAFLDLLFGIEMRSRFNFLHDYPSMRIGAALELGGRVHELIRVKQRQNDLRDAEGRPVAPGLIAGQLGNIDRESYRAMFSLDDDTLEAGGESILASRGDLGQLLFAASAGLADLSTTLGELRAETERFHKLYARGSELAGLKAKLAELKAERERIDTAAGVYNQMIDTRERSLAHYNEALATRGSLDARRQALQRQVGALPRLAALRAARLAMQDFADLPEAPPGWAEALPALQAAVVPLEVRTGKIEAEVAQKAADLEAIVIDEPALRCADRVAGLADLQARYVTAEKDIPARRQEVREQILAIAAVLVRIGRDGDPDPPRLVLDAATIGTLNALIARRSGIEKELETATRELTAAQDRLEEAQAALHDADGGTQTKAPPALLADAVAALRADDHASRRRVAERACDGHRETLADRLQALRPWQGDADQLAAAAVPEPAQVQAWKHTLTSAQSRHEKAEDDVERLTTETLRLQAERTSIAGVVSDQDAADIRAARDAAWTQHRRMLDPASADAFEAALRQDDRTMDARLRHQAEVARLHAAAAALARTEADLSRAQALLVAALAKLEATRHEIATAVAPLLPDGTSLIQFEAWLDKRRQALETRTALRQEEQALAQVAADEEAARQRLIAALTAAGVPHDRAAPLDALRSIAQAMLDREAKLQGLRATLQDRRRELKTRERNLAAAQERDQAWEVEWQAACAACWLGEAGTIASVPAVREILLAAAPLGPAIDKRTALEERIDAMQRDQATFAAEVAAIAAALGHDAAEPPLAVAQAITQRVQAAGRAVAQRAAAAKALAEARDRQRKLAEDRDIHDRRSAEMTGHFGVATLNEVAAKIADIANRKTLRAQAAEAERDILDALRVPSIEAAEAILDTADRTALDAELVDLVKRYEDQDQRTRDLFAAYSRAVDQLEAVGGDAAVARIEEQRQTTLLQIQEGARHYLRLRAGIAAAEQALRSYRQQHRSTMMEQASDAFRTISRGAYKGLASQPAKDNEVLVAVAADGSSKLAADLSKGTRFQLYLALRVAGYREFARMRAPVPFIADDIMETFDDFRAEEALRLLAGMAEVGQVIYLTHHRHLCAIAQQACPGVRIHDLAAA
jgi:uncharacterized protein YhaN